MATPRLTVATVAGEAGTAVEALFRSWRTAQAALDPAVVDWFCEQLRANGARLPIVYFCEWVDRWLMGDLVPGPRAVRGDCFEAACLSPAEAAAWAGRCGGQFPEQVWLAARLREAAEAWQPLAGSPAIVVVRQVLSTSATDQELMASLSGVPSWLPQLGESIEQGAAADRPGD